MMIYTECKILISYDTIKSSRSSTTPKSVSFYRSTNALIIGRRQRTATSEIMPIIKQPFLHIFKTVYYQPYISLKSTFF